MFSRKVRQTKRAAQRLRNWIRRLFSANTLQGPPRLAVAAAAAALLLTRQAPAVTSSQRLHQHYVRGPCIHLLCATQSMNFCILMPAIIIVIISIISYFIKNVQRRRI